MDLTDIEAEKILELIRRAKKLKYASIKIEIQDCKVTSIDVTEKIRF